MVEALLDCCVAEKVFEIHFVFATVHDRYEGFKQPIEKHLSQLLEEFKLESVMITRITLQRVGLASKEAVESCYKENGF